MFLALLLAASAAPVPETPTADWKPAIKNRAFKFEDEKSGPLNSIAAAKKAGIAAEFRSDPKDFRDGTFTFQKQDCPKVTASGHDGTPAVIRGDVLYVANFSPIANGCKVAAYDLPTGKKVWEKALDGIGAVTHSKYRNRVAMAVEKHPDANHFALVIVGEEAFGNYVEVLDLTTGKQLAHKRYGNEK